MDGPPTSASRHAWMKGWAACLAAVALGVAVYPFQPFTSSLPLVVAVVAVAVVLALAGVGLARSRKGS